MYSTEMRMSTEAALDEGAETSQDIHVPLTTPKKAYTSSILDDLKLSAFLKDRIKRQETHSSTSVPHFEILGPIDAIIVDFMRNKSSSSSQVHSTSTESPSGDPPSESVGLLSPEFSVHLLEGDILVRESSFEENEQVLIIEHARTWPRVMELPYNMNESKVITTSINGLGTPQVKRQAVTTVSEKSFITDSGAQGRRRLAAESDIAHVDLDSISEMKQRATSFEDLLLSAIQHIPGHKEKRGYFPEITLDLLITQDSVRRQLETCLRGVLDSMTIRRYTDIICGSGSGHTQRSPLKKIFAILVLSEKLASIGLFICEGLSDDDLPFRKVPRASEHQYLFDFARKGDRNKHPDILTFSKDWRSLERLKFEEWQWATQTPFFFKGWRKHVAQYLFEDQIPLPFTWDSRYDGELGERLEIESGYSYVFKVNIHPEQHGFRGYQFSCQHFAVKCLTSTNRVHYKREADVLLKFNDETHPHLISLLATYEQFNKFFLIFPWSEANLEEYWMIRKPRPDFAYSTILWVAEQCQGLADGLARIHRWDSIPESKETKDSGNKQQRLAVPVPSAKHGRLTGHHGDIKPQNVLWFQDNDKNDHQGILKITDFGLTEFKASHTTFSKAGNPGPITSSFRPPEYDLTGANGRSHDVWALGCVYLDFVAWLLGGWDLIFKFANARTSIDPRWSQGQVSTDQYFEISEKDGTKAAALKPAVVQFINDFHFHPQCTEYIHDFLNLIQFDMFHVVPHNPTNNSRMEIGEVNMRLTSLLQKCKDERYASTAAPWDSKLFATRTYADVVKT